MTSNPLESDHGMEDAPKRGSISIELELMEKAVTAQTEYLNQLFDRLEPIMRTGPQTKNEDAIAEAEPPDATALGNQIGNYTVKVRQNNARIQLILELLEL